MNNIDNIKEDISVGVDSTTMEIYLRLRATCDGEDSSSVDYKVYTDEYGQIVMMPTNTTCEFTSVEMLDKEEFESASTNTSEPTQKYFLVHLTANVLSETNDLSTSYIIDNVGQVVISLVNENNDFVSVTNADSLNLITEETAEESTEENTSEVPNVESEVIEESVDIDDTLQTNLANITDNFTEVEGMIQCDTIEEMLSAVKILASYYNNITYEAVNNVSRVKYCCPVNTNTEV